MSDFSPLIVVSELLNRIDEPDLRLIDCRFDLMNPQAGRLAWLDGHIPGAVYADLDNDLASRPGPTTGRHPLPDIGAICETFGRLGIDETTTVVVYDSGSGGIAARAWWLLRWLGHERVALLDGGFAAWNESGSPLETGPATNDQREFIGKPRNDRVIATEEILAAGDAISKLMIVDARDAGRFRGDVEPIDTVAGHIPGTRNLPFGESLLSNGRWKSPKALDEMWTRLLGGRPADAWGVMCGSGVTACHLALSAKLAGYPEPRLYVGSWSEWIRDPSRAVGRGDPEP